MVECVFLSLSANKTVHFFLFILHLQSQYLCINSTVLYNVITSGTV